MTQLIMSLDLGTTSNRVVLYDELMRQVAVAQREHRQYYPRPGWVEHDATELWQNIRELMGLCLARGGFTADDVVSMGITNQRETTVAWDKTTGQPVYRAIVWQDTRTDDAIAAMQSEMSQQQLAGIQQRTGLPLASYFSASKIAWILHNVDAAAELAQAGNLLVGTVDTWIIWNLTGGVNGGEHLTDVTNASRTGLMDIHQLRWDTELGELYGIAPELMESMLATIRPSVGKFGTVAARRPTPGTPITGVLGDQQAASFGQCVFENGEAKNTYGTGCFLLVNTGESPVVSQHGLLATVAFQLPGEPPRYALEGSIAQAGSVVQWLRDQLGVIKNSAEIEQLASTVEDNGGVYFVPAFSGLFAPYWRADARGTIIGLTSYSSAAHIGLAALEATAYQTHDVLEAVSTDTGTSPSVMRVDGGMSVNSQLMQFQADILRTTLVRPDDVETTARGAGFAAGLGAEVYSGLDDLRALQAGETRWEPAMDPHRRQRLITGWRNAVEHAVGWQHDAG